MFQTFTAAPLLEARQFKNSACLPRIYAWSGETDKPLSIMDRPGRPYSTRAGVLSARIPKRTAPATYHTHQY